MSCLPTRNCLVSRSRIPAVAPPLVFMTITAEVKGRMRVIVIKASGGTTAGILLLLTILDTARTILLIAN